MRNLWSLQRLLRKRAIKGRASFCLLGKIPLRRKVPDLTHPLTQHSINTECKVLFGNGYNLQHRKFYTLPYLKRHPKQVPIWKSVLEDIWKCCKCFGKYIQNIFEDFMIVWEIYLKALWLFWEIFDKVVNILWIFWICRECSWIYWKRLWMFYEFFEYTVNVLGYIGKRCEFLWNIWIYCECFWEIFEYAGKFW